MISRLFTALFILLLSYSIKAQDQRAIDSMTTRLQTNLHDTDRVETLNELGWELMYSNPDTSILISSEALYIAEKNEWELGIAQCHGRLGVYYYLKGNYHKALEYYFKVLRTYEEQDRKDGVARYLGNIGNVYHEQGNYSIALEYYFKALRVNEELDRKNGVGINLSNIGNIYLRQGEHTKALAYYTRSLTIGKEIENKRNIAADLNNIGNVHYEQEYYLKALDFYLQALQLDEEIGNTKGISIRLGNIGSVYSELFETADSTALVKLESANAFSSTTNSKWSSESYYEKAMGYYSKALKMNEEMGSKRSVSMHLGNIGNLLRAGGEFEEAEKTLKEALAISKEIGSKEYLRDQYEHLVTLYEAIDNPAAAFDAYKLLIIYSDSMHNEDNTKAQTRTEMKYEYEKQEIIKQQEEQELARVQTEATSRRDNLQYSIILIAILTLFGGVLMLGFINVSERMAEGIIFFSFLILFEFLLVLADPTIERLSGGAPGFKLLFNAGIAALIFPAHAFFESKLKSKLVKK